MRDRRTVLLALALIVLGGYLLLTELNAEIPGWSQIWPVLPVAAGLALLIGTLVDAERNPDQVFIGTAAVLVGLVFFFVTLGPLDYPDLETWWPVFVVIAGVAFLAQWAAAGLRRWDALFLGLIALVVGVAAFAVTFELLGPNTREALPRFWPVILILVGLVALLRGLLSRRTGPPT